MSKVLVTYASEHGATAEIAQTIARVMRQFDLDVTSRRIEAINDGIATYDAVILGSAVYLGDWLEEAQGFLKRYKRHLTNIPVWLFSSGPTGEGDVLELVNHIIVPEPIRELVDFIEPREVKVFHGKIDLRRLPKNERLMIKAAGVPRGDYRDWEAIKQWAMDVSRALTVQSLSIQPKPAIIKTD
jgi:menaquinone-dependent protoporphyrinogen oxidase